MLFDKTQSNLQYNIINELVSNLLKVMEAYMCAARYYNCVVVFFWSSGMKDFNVFTFDKKIRSCARGRRQFGGIFHYH